MPQPDRESVKRAFLKAAGLEGAGRRPLPGDASTRRYERLTLPGGARLILMDAPPQAEGVPCPPGAGPEARRTAGYNAMARLAAGRVDAFAATADYLRGRGLSAPRIEALDAETGLAVVEDLGDDLFARRIEAGADEAELYDAAVDALVRLHAEPPPEALAAPGGGTWPLLTYDDLALRTGADLLVEWLPALRPGLRFGEAARAEWEALWAPVRAMAEAKAEVFAHRDFHAENLIWLGDRRAAARTGMIDFQDAVRAHAAWDLHSLLQDARRDVPEALERRALDRYLAARDLEREPFLDEYAALAALNAARIVGVFARLAARDGKPRYEAFLPRMWRQLERNLAAPALAGLRAWFDRHVPREARR